MIISYLLIHITNRTTRTITMITANGIRAPRILLSNAIPETENVFIAVKPINTLETYTR
jgi:hypothetical protein